MPDDAEIIYLYSEIWAGDAGFFVARLLQAKSDVTIAMNSPGGDVFEAAAMYAAVKRYDKGRVTCRIDGIAASAASYLAMACDEVVMAESAFMMIHKPWSVVVGNQDDCERMARDLAQVEAAMVAAYAAKSGKSEREVRKMLEEETLMNASETVAQGFADRIEGDTGEAEPETPAQMAAKVKDTDRRVMAGWLSGAETLELARRNIAASRAQAVAATHVPVILDIQVTHNGQISAKNQPILAENGSETPENQPENATIQAESEPNPADPPPDQGTDQPRSAGIEEEPATEPAFSLDQPPTEGVRSMGDLNTLRARRGEKITALKGLIYDANGSIKALNEAETALHASLKKEVEDLGASIARAEEVEALMASTALPVAGAATERPQIVATEKPISLADQAGIYIALWAQANGDLAKMRKSASSHFGERHPIVATLNRTDDSNVVPTPMSDEIIELLRAQSVVLAAGPRRVDVPKGKLEIGAGATGSVASYGAEAANIAATEPTFRKISLDPKKLSAIVPISNEILNDVVNLGAWVREDLVTAMAERADLAFLRGDGTSNTPTGFLTLAQAGAKFNANATVNLANITNDLGKAELVLQNNNLRNKSRWVWFMAPRTLVFLSDLRDGNGNLAYPSLTNGNQPMLRMKPVYDTTQIPINLGGGTNQSEIYLVDMSHVLVGETGGMELATSSEASYFDGSVLQSAFARDMTLIRAIHRHDIDIRQLFAVAIIQQVTWGV